MAFEVMAPDPERRIQVALEDIRAGRMVILVDDEDRENEGDLTMAASMVTPEAINFMAKWGRGLICLTLTEERVAELQLPMMASNNRSPFATAFTVSVEAREGVSTGISAADRAHTIRVAIDPTKGPSDLISPGHVFPLRARDGGVLVRTGQTEGSVDLARLAGLPSSGVICEIMNDDGTMARMPDLERFAATHELHIVSVADVVRWRLRNERLVHRVFEAPMPTEEFGELRSIVYRDTTGGLHLALVIGDPAVGGPVLARVHASAGPVDVFRALTSDSSDQLRAALRHMVEEGRGVLLYLHIDGGPSQDVFLARLREQLLPGSGGGPEGDKLRALGTGAQILVDLGVRELRLLSNTPRKIVGLEGFGLSVVDRIPLHERAGSDMTASPLARREPNGQPLER
jgi:3,4-dihydroxy 2-butanone 4-phosphate synthase/GTP cyclohydrolase II